MKRFLKYLIVTVSTALLTFLMILIWKGNRAERALMTCAGVRVEIAEAYHFVTSEDIKMYLDEEYGAYVGQRLDSVDLKKVENILDNKSAVLKSEAWVTPDGWLNVLITQREPIVRFQTSSGGFYADDKGFIFPLQEGYTSLVPIIDGKVPVDEPEGFKGQPDTQKERQWIADVLDMVTFMTRSKVWAENISQITVKDNGDLVMTPRKGKEKFIFGPPDQAEDKFWRMGEYYRKIVPMKGEGYYSTVNVKFAKQIVCRK